MKRIRAKSLSLVCWAALVLVCQSTWADGKNLVVYGATGNIGGKIVTEALNRGYKVTGVSRNPAKFKIDHPSFTGVAGDVTASHSVADTIVGADAVIVSVHGKSTVASDTVHAQASAVMIEVCQKLGADAPRVLQVGGATTMSNSRRIMQQEITHLPFEAPEGSPMYAMLFGHWIALQNYRDSEIRWSVVTPAGSIKAGDRTGEFRLDTETAIVDAEGNSRISEEDFAVAIIDELENPQFIGRRFTVGY